MIHEQENWITWDDLLAQGRNQVNHYNGFTWTSLNAYQPNVQQLSNYDVLPFPRQPPTTSITSSSLEASLNRLASG